MAKGTMYLLSGTILLACLLLNVSLAVVPLDNTIFVNRFQDQTEKAKGRPVFEVKNNIGRIFASNYGKERDQDPTLENPLGPLAADVSIDFNNPVNHVGTHFVGVTIDDSMVKLNWSTLDFNSRKVLNMARALSPNYFRLGGTSADEMIYNITGQGRDLSRSSGFKAPSDFVMTETQWRQVNDFARAAGWDLIMDLNELRRTPDGSWDPTNARQLLQYSATNKYPIAGFELGNEYDIYNHQFQETVSPEQLAKDVAHLRQVLNTFPQYRSSFIIGPETAGYNKQYFQGFLAAGGAKVVNAASFHHYYFAGKNKDITPFTSVKTMEHLATELDTVLSYVKDVDPNLPIWLSETSTAYGGGTPEISDRFIAGFLWLDKLGLCAQKGLQAVIRQDFYGGNYALINNTLDPNSDFFLTVLYKRIVMGAVFNVTSSNRKIRVYSACAQQYRSGGVVVYGLNPNNNPATINIPQLQSFAPLVYVLTSSDLSDLRSKQVSLNGDLLQLVNDEVPALDPRSAPPGPFTLPPYSMAFLVFPDAKVSSCAFKA